jgi:electron transfer flavoprotein beta subunit
VKILVPLKRVADPDNANKIKVSPQKIDTTGLQFKPNPFDEYAVETALRLTENAASNKVRLGEVTVVTFGPKEAETTLRAALATGADKAIRVDSTDDALPISCCSENKRSRVTRTKWRSSSRSTWVGRKRHSRAPSKARATKRCSSLARSTAAR